MKFEYSIEIPAPPELVWQIAQDPSIRSEWDTRVKEYQIIDRQAKGGRIRFVIRLFGMRPVAEGEFVRFDPPLQSAIRIVAITPPALPPGGGTWIFDPIDGGTRMTTRFYFRPDNFGRLRRWLFRIGVSLDTLRSLRRLRKLVVRKHHEMGSGNYPAIVQRRNADALPQH